MISIGIDVSKEKSTVCILKPHGEIISTPYEITHTEKELSELSSLCGRLDGEVRVIMEATGNYHLPVLSYLKAHDIFVAVINPYVMKKYATAVIRKGKTDKLDAIKIAGYGLDNWFHLTNYETSEETYAQLRLLGRQYAYYIKLRVQSKHALTNMLDYTMPGIKRLLRNDSSKPDKEKLNDFAEKYWHFDNITAKNEHKFTEEYLLWAKKKGYRPSKTKAAEIYALAKDGIPTLSSGIPLPKC